MKSEKPQKQRLFQETQKTDPKRFLKKSGDLQPMKKSTTILLYNFLAEFAG
jgi:hypothetical protein